jgi:uncharacterized protein
MQDKLRKRYQVQKEVTQSGRFEGEIELSELKRLGELLYPGSAAQWERKIALEFEFTCSEFDIPMLAGHLQTRLALECQRCLQSLELPMELDFKLLIDADEDIVRHGSEDTLYSEDGYIDIAEVVEDELILAAYVHGDKKLEEHFHCVLAHERIRGEWFNGPHTESVVCFLLAMGPDVKGEKQKQMGKFLNRLLSAPLERRLAFIEYAKGFDFDAPVDHLAMMIDIVRIMEWDDEIPL